MAIKPIAITEDEIQIYEQEDSLAKLYERRQDEYDELMRKLDVVRNSKYITDEAKMNLSLDICNFLLREAQFKKLV